MKKTLSILLVLVLLLSLNGTALAAQSTEDPVWGEYHMTDMNDGSGEDGAARLKALAELGIYATLTIGEDGSGVLDLLGEEETVTVDFEKQVFIDQGSGTEIPYAYADGMLTLSQGGMTMEFTKVDPAEAGKKAEGAFTYYELESCVDRKEADLLPALKEKGAAAAAILMELKGKTAELDDEALAGQIGKLAEGMELSEGQIGQMAAQLRQLEALEAASLAAWEPQTEKGTLYLFQNGLGFLDLYGLPVPVEFDLDNGEATLDGERANASDWDDKLELVKRGGSEIYTFLPADPGWKGYYVLTELESPDQGDMSEQLELLAGMGMLPGMVIEEDGSAVLDLFGVEMKMQFDFEKMTVTAQGQTMPFKYENGVISLENESNAMVLSRGVAPESSMGLTELVEAMNALQ